MSVVSGGPRFDRYRSNAPETPGIQFADWQPSRVILYGRGQSGNSAGALRATRIFDLSASVSGDGAAFCASLLP
jgi:hypothetical protein